MVKVTDKEKTLHSSPFLRKPLCLSVFRGVKSFFQLFTHSSPLFTRTASSEFAFLAPVLLEDYKSAETETDWSRNGQGEEW